jgi:endoglucanase
VITQPQLHVLTDLLALPTSPFHERYPLAYVRDFCRQHKSLALAEDPFGNLLAHYRPPRRRNKRPVVLEAHLDHPGFESLKMIGEKRLRAAWRGGVLPEFFVDSGVRFWLDDESRWVRGTVRKIRTHRPDPDRPPRVLTADIDVARPVPPARIGMWDLPDPRVRGGRIYARLTDDLAGVAAILCAMRAVLAKRPPVEFYAMFPRAEEVGFAGTLAACEAGLLPKGAVVINVENSSVLPGVTMGAGPIIRVGDRLSLFSPPMTAYLAELAETRRKSDKSFRYQRKLMDGGACEATAFCDFGYETGAVCLPLGNYHNMDKAAGKIGPEYISLDDFANLVKLLTAVLLQDPPYAPPKPGPRKQLRDLIAEHTPTLRRTVAANRLA